MLTHEFSLKQKPKRVVLIGAKGFIGQVLHRQLVGQEIETLALTSSDVDLTAAGAAKRLADIFDEQDCVIMLAALTPDRGRDIATFQANLVIAESVCEALRRQPVAHVIYMSSDAVYSMATTRISEQTPAAPDDLYGLMHRTRELMFKQVGAAPLAILRSTMVAGVGDTHNSYGPNRFRRQAKEQGFIQLGGKGEETRDHIYSEDVAALVIEIIQRRSSGLLNAVTGKSYSFHEVANLVSERARKPVTVKTSERTTQITHRSFDTTATNKAFPGFTFMQLPDALNLILEQEPI
ncbi:NAD(P)-dependent oxidoreductase [Thalassospira lucentensis]|uniref:NAD-dependent epimerase/dehydratase family protein n=1 Tax=Thalassospira lucentensis TaxID=168935 RepID=UPI002942819E|nr:NAD(P)-dependent oxidoreductase [Thalassospira lucentensis]WOI11823.1 NAD(P)-dependent oxidoreductase [Thalassospira lucentensis]